MGQKEIYRELATTTESVDARIERLLRGKTYVPDAVEQGTTPVPNVSRITSF